MPSLAMNAWYLDDGTFSGNLVAALHIVEGDGPLVGQHFNCHKSLLYIPSQCDSSNSPLPPEIPVTWSGLTLLGCPVDPHPNVRR